MTSIRKVRICPYANTITLIVSVSFQWFAPFLSFLLFNFYFFFFKGEALAYVLITRPHIGADLAHHVGDLLVVIGSALVAGGHLAALLILSLMSLHVRTPHLAPPLRQPSLFLLISLILDLDGSGQWFIGTHSRSLCSRLSSEGNSSTHICLPHEVHGSWRSDRRVVCGHCSRALLSSWMVRSILVSFSLFS